MSHHFGFGNIDVGSLETIRNKHTKVVASGKFKEKLMLKQRALEVRRSKRFTNFMQFRNKWCITEWKSLQTKKIAWGNRLIWHINTVVLPTRLQHDDRVILITIQTKRILWRTTGCKQTNSTILEKIQGDQTLRTQRITSAIWTKPLGKRLSSRLCRMRPLSTSFWSTTWIQTNRLHITRIATNMEFGIRLPVTNKRISNRFKEWTFTLPTLLTRKNNSMKPS